MPKYLTAVIFLRSIFVLVLLMTTVALADEAPFLIKDSRSPNGRIEIWIKPVNPNEGMAAGTAQIRDVKTQNILSPFEWSGFGVRLLSTDPDPAFTVLWRPDSKYFAIKYEEGRGWVTSAIYGLGGNGQWTEVKLPSDEYVNRIKKMSGVSELRGKGCERPKEWLSNGDLNLEFIDMGIEYGQEDVKAFVVTLRVEDQKRQPLGIAQIVSTKQESHEEAEREVHKQ